MSSESVRLMREASDGSDFDIFAVPSRRGHDARRGGGDEGLGQGEQLDAEVGVELRRDVARQLEMLLLVLADGDVGRLIGEHVRGLEHRVGEQADARAFAVLAGLVLPLRHAVEPAHPRSAGEQPFELGMRGDARLVEQRRAVGVDARGNERGGHLDRVAGEHGGLDRDGDRVQVGEEEQTVIARLHAVLHRDPLLDRAQIVAEVEVAGGLDAGDDAQYSVLSHRSVRPERSRRA